MGDRQPGSANSYYIGISKGTFNILLWSSQSVVSNSVPPWTAARQPSLSFTISWSLLILMSIELVMPCNHLILCRPLLLLPLVFPSISLFLASRLFISNGQIIGASASVLPSEYSALISFWNDWFDLLAV